MATKQITADNSKELTLKVLMYLARCQEQGISPQSIALHTDTDSLYSVKIITKEVSHEQRTTLSH